MLKELQHALDPYKKYLPVLFFIGGFIWDSMTLGRVDSLYSNMVLCTYLICLTFALYFYNISEDGRWENTLMESYEHYFPLAVQFFLVGHCSAYVIFYSRSVSLTKTIAFFIILVILLFANELLKHRISNKYLQFGAYFFVNFTFFTFFLPIVLNTMNSLIFVISGFISLCISLCFILFIYFRSPSTRKDISGFKVTGLILGLYALINLFYFFNLIPPVPLSLEKGFVAQKVEKQQQHFEVTYQASRWYTFWRSYSNRVQWTPGDSIFVFTSIFAPADLEKSVYHRWKWFSPGTNGWQITDKIGYQITGGRDEGYRGFTYKQQLASGRWSVDVITGEGLVLGSIDFKVVKDSSKNVTRIRQETF